MLINELAKKSGVTVHTIRFYEKSGLIKGKRDTSVLSNNYFHYDDEAVEKLELINAAKAIGFSLNEITELLHAWYSNKLTIVQKLKVLDDKLVTINEKIEQLKQVKKQFTKYRKDVADGKC